MKRVASLPDTAQLQRQDPFSKIRQLQTPSEGDRGIGVEAKCGAGGVRAGCAAPSPCRRRSPLPKLLLALMFPFVPVWVYALWHMFNAALLLLYMTLLLCYFVVLGAYIVAELSICPPWYQVRRPARARARGEQTLPHSLGWPAIDAREGAAHARPARLLAGHRSRCGRARPLPCRTHSALTSGADPLQDFQLPFEEIEFRNADGMTLRGWWVPGLDPNPDLAVVRVVACVRWQGGGPLTRPTLQVFCHGGGRDRRAWLRHVPIFHRAGLPCLLFDLREHGAGAGRGWGRALCAADGGGQASATAPCAVFTMACESSTTCWRRCATQCSEGRATLCCAEPGVC